MEEIEVPLEQLHEEMHHHAEHSQEKWISGVALSSALLAVFAAIAALLAGHHANEAMIDQMHASDHWAYYQAKGIKASILSSKLEILNSFQKSVSPAIASKTKKSWPNTKKTRKRSQTKRVKRKLPLVRTWNIMWCWLVE